MMKGNRSRPKMISTNQNDVEILMQKESMISTNQNDIEILMQKESILMEKGTNFQFSSLFTTFYELWHFDII